ncbi:protein DGCR14, partial [Trifolium medium]|nr:protein DGCR14 [Trifolium medium]
GSTFVRNFTPLDEFDGKTPIVPGLGVSERERVREKRLVELILGLDQFLGRYTSEDNQCFSKILERVNRKRKERFGYLNDSVNVNANGNAIEDEKRDRITDGYVTSYQPPSTLEGWNYTAKNLLIYHPADRGEVPLTEEE